MSLGDLAEHNCKCVFLSVCFFLVGLCFFVSLPDFVVLRRACVDSGCVLRRLLRRCSFLLVPRVVTRSSFVWRVRTPRRLTV